MGLFGKNHLTIAVIIALALAGLLLFGFFQTKHKYQETPDTRLATALSKETEAENPAFSSEMETNAPSQQSASASFSDSPPLQAASRTTTKTLPPAATISLEDIKACMKKSVQQIGPCYDALFHVFLKTRTTADALKIVAHYEETDAQLRYACHPVVHAIGRETFAKTRTVHDSFAACDQTCHSGCYHGAMERFIRGDQAENGGAKHITEKELASKTVTACPANQPSRFRFQCLHGLGHALLFSLEYNLTKTLQTCDKLGTAWDRSSCWGGAFMENLFPADPANSDISATDYHYPCSKLGEQYKTDCYVMQTTRMSAMGLDAAGLFDECRKAGAYALACIQSIGRDLSNDARIKDPRLTAEKCELGQTDAERQSCIRGVIYALMDNTWDGRYAFPLCQSFSSNADRAYCAGASARYLQTTYDKTKEIILKDCVLRTKDQTACEEAVKEL
ncbi:MAG: hypothetical protein HY617_01525 [Candidatus Sungbacteria bacterium]|nr:hypothetical protein [Candidatus Sungbacteria bacterium]